MRNSGKEVSVLSKWGSCVFITVMVVVALFSEIAWTHNPIVINGGPTDASTAYKITDISVSRVAYHHAKEGQPFLWLTFEGKKGQELNLQMGVPKLDRYANIRPVTAILGPGFPAIKELSFPVPKNMGALLLTTEEQEPEVFHEEFTGTVDWMFKQEKVILSEDGVYFMVSYIPSGEEGKFWVAPGTREAFGLWDLIRMPSIVVKARLFHEAFPWGGILGWVYLGFLLILLVFLTAVIVLFAWVKKRFVKAQCASTESKR